MNEQPVNADDGLEQMPVDARIFRVSFVDGGLEMIRILAMSSNQTPSYSPFQEYHHNDTSCSIEGCASFTLRTDAVAASEEAINAALGAMPRAFTTPQPPAWRRGVKTSTAARQRLYKAQDPDDKNLYIGVLVEQDETGKLLQLTWYKTREAAAIFRTMPSSLAFTLVLDGAGAPSVDPNDIGRWTWYYTTNLPSYA